MLDLLLFRPEEGISPPRMKTKFPSRVEGLRSDSQVGQLGDLHGSTDTIDPARSISLVHLIVKRHKSQQRISSNLERRRLNSKICPTVQKPVKFGQKLRGYEQRALKIYSRLVIIEMSVLLEWLSLLQLVSLESDNF
jgi:hypothetical protein